MANLLEPFAGAQAEAVAGRLLQRFGSLHRALISPEEDGEPAEDADVLRQVRAARKLVLEASREEIARQPVGAGDAGLHEYLKGLLGSQTHEVLHAVFLDRGSGYIADEHVSVGTHSRISGSTRQLIKRALELGARSVILAHNHPSGCPLPSQCDIDTTARIREMAAELELALLDHLIVTQRAVFSFRAEGYFETSGTPSHAAAV